MSATLIDLKISQEGRIASFADTLQPDFRRRLKELGFREGISVRCLRKTPFGGPKVFEVAGSVFSIEHEVALLVHIDSLPEV